MLNSDFRKVTIMEYHASRLKAGDYITFAPHVGYDNRFWDFDVSMTPKRLGFDDLLYVTSVLLPSSSITILVPASSLIPSSGCNDLLVLWI